MIIETLTEMFSYAFLIRAFVVGSLVSVCAALLGVSLVLKRYSMIGDGLSHVGFGALALATALNAAPLAVSIPVVLAAAFLLLRLGEKSLIKGDAAIALVSTASLALGVIIISQTTGMNTDVCNYLFGSILAMSKTDVYLSIALSIIVFSLFILFYNKLFAVTFDETFAEVSGIKTNVITMLIAFLTAITIVLGMRMMGAMLISALIIFPALTSMRIFKTFKSVSVCSICVSISCFFIGVTLSYIYAIPTGASVVLINIIMFIIFWLIKAFNKNNVFVKKAILTSIALSFFTSCMIKENAQNTEADIEIKEKMFISQVNDVYLNQNDYIGKTIKIEGLLKQESYPDGEHCFVIRYGPGCCGNDGNAGFEIAWDGSEKSYPKEDSWIEALGVLKTYTEDDYPYLYISLKSLEKKEKRGAEFVTQ